MKISKSVWRIMFLPLILFAPNVSAQTIDISKNAWSLWLDKNATWENDDLFLPPVDISKLPTNAPTCGWDKLSDGRGKSISLPATVEEYFWGENGNRFGIDGDYTGVSWFSSKLEIPANFDGKRIVLLFESARLRTEVYLDRQLVGYDMINGTEFEIDITKFAKPGKKHQLDIRITDPNGNFAWRDWETYSWGKYEILPSHGFGGITGKVMLTAKDKIFVEDVFVKNKPEITSVDVEVSIKNDLQSNSSGSLVYALALAKEPQKILLEKTINIANIKGGETVVVNQKISYPKAKLWSLETPELYVVNVKWNGKNGTTDLFTRRFGFRWFEIKNTAAGDRQFMLNNKRIVLRTAISWGHWPVNGIYPTYELARKQILMAKEFGLNMLNFHRGIGQTMVFDIADELGLLYYQEPGGYKPGESEFAKAFKREKLLRMVKRDRNHPSLVIYNMINEAGRDPFDNEKIDIADAHKLDETRCITFSSQFYTPRYHNSVAPLEASEGKMFMEPYNHKIYFQGWYDDHHAGGPGVYSDEFYKSPTDFLRYLNHPSEIIFFGEEGAIGTLPRLDLIKKELDNNKLGWDGDTYSALYDVYNQYLTKNGFLPAFKSLEYFLTEMGKISYYYQGRIIENCRIGNLVDGYAVNGWESTKIENHSGIVDVYRNPKSDPKIISKYNQPLYVAVKIRNKVLETGKESVIDFYIVNEKDLKGSFQLKVTAQDEKGEFFVKQFPVKISGGNNYGELLVQDVKLSTRKDGYTTVKAELLKGKTVVAEGDDQLYTVSLFADKVATFAVIDSSKKLDKVLKKIDGIKYNLYDKVPQNIKEHVALIGNDLQPGIVPGNFRMDAPIMDWVARGNRLVFIVNAEIWGEYLNEKEILDYRGSRKIQTNWFGGNYFVKDNPLFDGLPTNCFFNWEYQSIAQYKNNRFGIRVNNGNVVVGVTADHKQEVLSAVVVIPHGKGEIILSTLDIVGAIKNENPSNAVAKKLLINFVK